MFIICGKHVKAAEVVHVNHVAQHIKESSHGAVIIVNGEVGDLQIKAKHPMAYGGTLVDVGSRSVKVSDNDRGGQMTHALPQQCEVGRQSLHC